MESQVGFLTFFHFAVVNSLQWSQTVHFYNSILLNLALREALFLVSILLNMVLLEALFLILGFSLMTFLMMLFVILPSMLIILFPALSVVSILICGNGKNWLVNLNLTYQMVRTRAGKRLSISVLEKLSLFHLTVQVIVLM